MCEFRADQNAAIGHIEFSRDDTGWKRTKVGFQLRVHAAHPGRGDLGLAVWRLRFEQHLTDDVWRDTFDRRVSRDLPHYAAKFPHRGVVLHNPQVRIEPEDFLAQLPVEPAHDADDDDEHRD